MQMSSLQLGSLMTQSLIMTPNVHLSTVTPVDINRPFCFGVCRPEVSCLSVTFLQCPSPQDSMPTWKRDLQCAIHSCEHRCHHGIHPLAAKLLIIDTNLTIYNVILNILYTMDIISKIRMCSLNTPFKSFCVLIPAVG